MPRPNVIYRIQVSIPEFPYWWTADFLIGEPRISLLVNRGFPYWAKICWSISFFVEYIRVSYNISRNGISIYDPLTIQFRFMPILYGFAPISGTFLDAFWKLFGPEILPELVASGPVYDRLSEEDWWIGVRQTKRRGLMDRCTTD